MPDIVLVACVHNAGRSQMSAAWFDALAEPELPRAASAGSVPGSHVHPEVLEAMNKVGIELSDNKPQLLTKEPAEKGKPLALPRPGALGLKSGAVENPELVDEDIAHSLSESAVLSFGPASPPFVAPSTPSQLANSNLDRLQSPPAAQAASIVVPRRQACNPGMAMAVALAGSSLGATSALKSRNTAFGAGVQGLKPISLSVRKIELLKRQLPAICAKLNVAEKSNVAMSGETALAGALFAALASSDSALAVQQLDSLATAGEDARALSLLVPLVPALLWVLYNILQPGLNQLNRMRGAKALVGGVGLGALASSLLVAPHADAVQELATIADNDQRGFLVLGVLVAALGWVAFNIFQPALNQLNKMKSSKGLVGALGLGAFASLMASPSADAVQELATIAEGDQRPLLVLAVLAAALGWVLFNILQPGLNQLNKMRSGKGLVGAIGLSAAASSLLSAGDADAVQELGQLAEGDQRPLLVLGVIALAIGWVLFNILQPALNQLNKMRGGK